MGGGMSYEGPVRSRRVWRLPVKLSVAVACLGILANVGGGIALVAGFHTYSVSSSTMEPTLVPGELLVGESVSPAALRRGDVVLVDPTEWGMAGPVIRRVIGTGGDRVACCTSGHVTVDGQPLDEPYATSANGGLPGYAVTVPPGRVFLLGDNRSAAIDSRLYVVREQGTLPASAAATRVVWSSRGGFAAGGSKSLVIYLVLVTVGSLLLALGVIALAVNLIRSARRSHPVALPPPPGF